MSVPEGRIVQTHLLIPPAVAAGIARGDLIQLGGVVRRVADGTIHTLLKEVSPPLKAAQEVATRTARARPNLMLPVVLAVSAVGVAAAGASVVVRRRRTAVGPHAAAEVPVNVPECVRKFEASLRAYLGAARDGALDAATVGRLIEDLDEVRAGVAGSNAADYSLEQLEPVFSLIIGHTASLAKDYSVAPAALEGQGFAPDAGIVRLRQHLDAQKLILDEVA